MIIDVRYLWNKSEVNCGLAFFDVQEVNKEHQELLFKKTRHYNGTLVAFAACKSLFE